MTDISTAAAEDTSIGADLLSGVPAIAEFLFGRADRQNVRRTYYLCEKGLIPCGKLGASWVTSRRRLREHMAAITGAAA